MCFFGFFCVGFLLPTLHGGRYWRRQWTDGRWRVYHQAGGVRGDVPAAASRPPQIHAELPEEGDPGMGITQRTKITNIWQKSRDFWFCMVESFSWTQGRKVNHNRLDPMDLNFYTLANNTATVTRQLTKSMDFRQKMIPTVLWLLLDFLSLKKMM